MSLSSWWAGTVAKGAANQALAAGSGAPPEPSSTSRATPLPASLTGSPEGVTEAAFTSGFEGFRGVPYQDVAGVWTYGYGSTRDGNGNPVTKSTPAITASEARVLLERDLTGADHTVAADVHVPLTPMQKAALADFVYNLGCGALGGSTLLKKLNAGDLAGAAAEFDKWDHAGGREVAGLLRRRDAERQAFTAEA